jgi:hypothetical protein
MGKFLILVSLKYNSWEDLKPKYWMRIIMGTQIFQKSRSCYKIPGARRMTGCKFYTEEP